MNRAWAGVLLAWVLIGCGDGGGSPDGGGPTPELRGQYLVNNVGLCTFCHTPLLPDGTRDNTRFLAGDPHFFDIDPENAEVGLLPSRNLTPHATGLGNRSNAEIKAAIRDGKRTDGANLSVVMPSWIFHNMTDADLDAVVAYLRSLTPVDQMIPPRQPPWNDVPSPIPAIDPETIPKPRADYPELARAERGRYLAGMAGLCIDCHTPDDPDMVLLIDRSRFFQGNRAFPAEALGLQVPPYPPIVHTANVTPDVATGAGRYTIAELVRIFRTGRDKENEFLCAPTHGGPNTPYAGLTEADAEDIAHYILSMPAVAAEESSQCTAVQ